MYDIDFPGFSGVARRTAALYDLPDPLQYMEYPWDPKRWRSHVRATVNSYWTALLKEKAQPRDSLNLFDTSRLSTSTPHPIWTQAGRDALSVKKTCVVNWLLLGVFQTEERLNTIGKNKSPRCVLCHAALGDRLHFMLSCPLLNDIRENFICQMVTNCPPLMNHLSFCETLLIAIIDPESPKLPQNIREGWIDISVA